VTRALFVANELTERRRFLSLLIAFKNFGWKLGGFW